LQTLSRADLERLWARESKQIIRSITPEYERFRDYWLDRPQVEAVRVRSDGDSSMLSGGVRRPVASPLDFRRRGIALALYRQAALWMGERGLSLHASSLQSPEAARAWASLERAGLVITERSGYGERRRLDAARVKEESGLAAQIPTLHHGHRRLVESASERDEVGLG
jgi:DNA-binding transcriptional ArsR family regulator